MDPQFVQQLIERLLKTGEILATEAFKLAVRQIYTYAIIDVVCGVLFLIAGIILLTVGIKKYKEWDEDIPSSMVICGIISTIIGLFDGLMSIRYFMNPNWYAVKLLIETFLRK